MDAESRHFTVEADAGPSYFVIGDIITVKVPGDQSDDKYLIVEVVSQPGGGPAFLHTHTPQETFHVIDGVFEVYGQDENGEKYAIRAEAGDLVHVPGDVPHGFKNVGAGPARMILTYHPAQPMLELFQTIGVPMPDRHSIPAESDQLSPDEIMAILPRYLGLVEMPG
jgi:quercetin dioxygenase-like cupin family protein